MKDRNAITYGYRIACQVVKATSNISRDTRSDKPLYVKLNSKPDTYIHTYLKTAYLLSRLHLSNNSN